MLKLNNIISTFLPQKKMFSVVVFFICPLTPSGTSGLQDKAKKNLGVGSLEKEKL